MAGAHKRHGILWMVFAQSRLRCGAENGRGARLAGEAGRAGVDNRRPGGPGAPGRFDPDRAGMRRAQGAPEQREVLAGRTGPGVMGCLGNLLRGLTVEVRGRRAVRGRATRPRFSPSMPVQGVDGTAQKGEPDGKQRDNDPARGHEGISLRLTGPAG